MSTAETFIIDASTEEASFRAYAPTRPDAAAMTQALRAYGYEVAVREWDERTSGYVYISAAI